MDIKRLKDTVLFITLFISIVTLAACVGYYSKPFEPNSSEGREAYNQAQNNTYPKQVRDSPDEYSNLTISWAGIVKGAQPLESRHGPAVAVFIEHRYFDWIEDHGAQPELFFYRRAVKMIS